MYCKFCRRDIEECICEVCEQCGRIVTRTDKDGLCKKCNNTAEEIKENE